MRQNVFRFLYFKGKLMSRSCDLWQVEFLAPKVDIDFPPFSLGPPFAKCHKMGDLGVLAKCVITLLCGQFWSRRLRQTVIRSLGYKCILKSRSCDLRQGVFKATKFGLLFPPFSLGPLFAKSQKMRDLGALAKFVKSRNCGQFKSGRLRRNVVPCLHFKSKLMSTSCDLRQVEF